MESLKTSQLSSCLVQWTALLAFLSGCLVSTQVWAAASATYAVIRGPSMVVYSGPSYRFRPVTVLKRGKVVPVSKRRFQGPDGPFYKVYVKLRGGQKKVGYVSASEDIRIVRKYEQDDLTQYETLELAQSSLQIGFQALQKDNYIWSIGYLKYPGPGIYLKGFTGQILNQASSNSFLGGEVGIDHSLGGHISLFTHFAMAGVFASQDNALFVASETANMMSQGGIGLRYNVDSTAAVTAGVNGTSFFNQNNATMMFGVGVTVEVGL